jgi:hypothetical protein
MIKFSHIGALHNVVQVVRERRATGAEIARVPFRGRVKLHGSNAGVVCEPGRVQPQSRNRELSLAEDNLAFAAFAGGPAQLAAVRTLEAELREHNGLPADRRLALFGEWIGPGVQGRVAVSKLPARQWVLFAAAAITADEEIERKTYFEVPKLGERFADASIYSIADAPEWHVTLDFEVPVALELSAGYIDELTREVEQRCPWAARFGVDGIGEGLVWQPLGQHFGDSELFFKSKGELHQVARKQKPASLDPERLSSVGAFVDYAVTDARLAQGLEVLAEQQLPLELRSLGAFLSWVGNDVKRECAAELETSNLEWKNVAKQVNSRAKDWFRKQLPQW